MANTEDVILMGMIHVTDFRRKALTKTKPLYFETPEHKVVVEGLLGYYAQYEDMPSKEALEVTIANRKGIKDDLNKSSLSLVEKLYSDKFREAAQKINLEWLFKTTQEHYRNKALFNAIFNSVDILEGKNKKQDANAIPGLLEEALAVTFDDGQYHDYFEDAEERYEYFHTPLARIPFKLKMLNLITNGGLLRKTLNVFVGPTGAGKTMFLCDHAAQWVKDYNVLYVSLEMTQELIANRIDANMMDLEIDDTQALPKENFVGKIRKLRKANMGQLYVAEYPPNTFTANDLAFLIEEIKQTRGFDVDIVMLDYLNLGASMRYKSNGDVNSYTYVKSVAEEFRACAIKKNFCLVTATQTNREGQNNSDFELNQVSESHGLSMTADFMIGGVVTPEMEKLFQMRIKQLKNRYGSLLPNSFIIGIDRAKMKMYDVDVPNQKLKQRIEAGDEDVSEAVQINTRQKSAPAAKSGASDMKY